MSAIVESKVPAKSAFQLKSGLYHFMTLKLLTLDLAAIEEQIAEQILQAPNFFRSASVVLDLQQLNKELADLSHSPDKRSIIELDNPLNSSKHIDFAAIGLLLRKKGLFPIGVMHATEEQRAQAIKAGLSPLNNSNNNSRSSSPRSTSLQSAAVNSSTKVDLNTNKNATATYGSKLITAPIRSGQQIYAAEGDLIITAAVSNGAEILADGNIHIYGPLRGRALAGINGNKDARIFCQSLEAELISIAGQFKISEDFAREHWKTAVEISLQEDRLQIKAL